VGQGKLYDNAVSGDSRTASWSGGRISSFQEGVLQLFNILRFYDQILPTDQMK